MPLPSVFGSAVKWQEDVHQDPLHIATGSWSAGRRPNLGQIQLEQWNIDRHYGSAAEGRWYIVISIRTLGVPETLVFENQVGTRTL